MIKALIFDWYGVCAERWVDVWVREVGNIVEEDSLRKAFLKYLDEHLKGDMTGEQFLESVFREVNINPMGYEYLVTKHGELNNQLLDMIHRLKGNYKTALLSDNAAQMVPVIEKEIGGFSRYFDAVILSNVVKMVKIGGKIFDLIIKELDEKPEDCLFVDDRERNIPPARDRGFKTILFHDNAQLEQEMRKHGVSLS